ncbi:MAG: MBL fold metallo-hydrolase [Dehalococcoidales bacterium]|nr:MBL fold metallo-hydrolase [Dehalococcoidales bacterium]
MKRFLLFFLLGILLVIGLSQASCIIPETTTTNNNLKVYFIDVGQGDAILLDYGTTEVLIDGGSTSPGVTSFLQQYVNGSLEVMVATHAHADHIGGLADLLNTFNVGQIWHSGDTSTSVTYNSFMAAVNNEGAEVYIGKRGNIITAGKLSFTVMNPEFPTGTSNNNSLVLWLRYGDIDFMFEGDAEVEAEEAMLNAEEQILPDVEILKVGHHCSRTASSLEFLAVIRPEVAVYMAATGNIYGHPHQEALTNLYDIGTQIYGTDVNGNVKIETDGQTYTIQLERAGTPQAP